MRNKMKLLILALVVLSLLSTTKARADSLYAITFSNEFLSIDTATGAGTLIGNLDSDMLAFGLADLGDAIYTFDQQADRIQRLDPATGSTLETIDIGVTTVGEGGIAFRSDGIGFMSRSNGPVGTLWSFDITVPNSTQISGDDDMVPSMDGLDFDSSDVLHGLSQTSDTPPALYTINQSTGVTTLIGSTGISGSILGGLTFASDGTLYAVIDDSLYTLNPGTGAATLVGPIGYGVVSGLTAASGVVEVKVDIKPQSCPNPLNVKSQGVLPVAILGTENFDVYDVSWAMLEGIPPTKIQYYDATTPIGDDAEECECNEAGPDGYMDLVLYFETQEIVGALGLVEDGDVQELNLMGENVAGIPIEGSDCIRIIKKGKDQQRRPERIK